VLQGGALKSLFERVRSEWAQEKKHKHERAEDQRLTSPRG
jgi:hypothetical protein